MVKLFLGLHRYAFLLISKVIKSNKEIYKCNEKSQLNYSAITTNIGLQTNKQSNL